MYASNIPGTIIERPTLDRPLRSARVRQALRLWLSMYRLNKIMEALAAQNPAIARNPQPARVQQSYPPNPSNQATFHDWLHHASLTVFQCERRPHGPIFPIDPPTVKGLTTYGARCGTTKFYAAWVEWSGTFLGWMRVQPQVIGVESDYAVGEVLERPLFRGITIDLSGHDALDRFSAALRSAAWDLGVAGG